jgi:hypothetical protein
MFQIEILINEYPKNKKKNHKLNQLWIHKIIIFIQYNIHAKVFLYIYDRKIWIVKHVIIPIDY